MGLAVVRFCMNHNWLVSNSVLFYCFSSLCLRSASVRIKKNEKEPFVQKTYPTVKLSISFQIPLSYNSNLMSVPELAKNEHSRCNNTTPSGESCSILINP
ncbi:hypothetical protein AVEN_271325-1 [Araneus ventricosus]|uniref:Uncharacterized protein n=1 Tax=Araneus ventricosus TaxID=182803 RepID=A0A4Y2DD94_ARAVE|nr:hypothetical protein AVEN_271325-1 [Araneus ventricosus]